MCKYYLIILLFILGNSAGFSQKLSAELPKITLKEKTLEDNIISFVENTNAKVVDLRISLKDSIYYYQIIEQNFFETVTGYKPKYWGVWRNKIIIFPEANVLLLDKICSINDPNKYQNLTTLLNVVNNILVHKNGRAFFYENFYYNFKIKFGKEIDFDTNVDSMAEQKRSESIPLPPSRKY